MEPEVTDVPTEVEQATPEVKEKKRQKQSKIRKTFIALGVHLLPGVLSVIAVSFTGGVIGTLADRLPGGRGTAAIMIGSAAAPAYIAVATSLVAAGVVISFKNLQEAVEKRFRKLFERFTFTAVASGILLTATAGVAVCVAITNRLVAGFVLAFFGLLRWTLRAVQGDTRAWTTMRSHVKSEIFFHCVSIGAVAIGSSLMISGYPRDGFIFAQRAALVATLLLASVIAVNKATARARKVCTEIYKTVKTVEVSEKKLLQTLSWGNDLRQVERILDSRAALLKEIRCLQMALRTRINSGYAWAGSTILPLDERRELIAALEASAKTAAADLAEGITKWEVAKQELDDIARACTPLIDIAA
ncbi:hypothetical protein ACPCSC_08095 [Streptomyces lavendulocolor]|uniref:hypothetical protein n=1 Tax=Streptomyces lavendulocolor TaxID=67316 RepID=UPI003C2F4265